MRVRRRHIGWSLALQMTEEFEEFVRNNTAARAVGGKSEKSDMKSLTDTVRAMPQ